MYAIKVVLEPEESTPVMEQRACDVAASLLRGDPQRGAEHITLVSSPPRVVAMTFVSARDLLEAECLALTAWTAWLTRTWPTGWRLYSCAGDLPLGVMAAAELYSDPPYDGTA
ncbi:hypothetical protein ABZ354_20020 [Streptomyces sp. NPDC005925]|uniref:hypothetical protein n=1 Tax=Streptomyces sp. NPDC005925 TaxID=3157172 RepID=UPI0033EECFAD